MKIALGSDKSGFMLKEAIKNHLLEQDYEVTDFGASIMEEAKPYYEMAPVVAEKIQSGEYERGILICGTGMGMALVANKYKGVYAAVVESVYAARKCRAINNANILTMGGWLIGQEMGVEIADVFLHTEFTQGLEEWRRKFLSAGFQTVQRMEEKIYGESK